MYRVDPPLEMMRPFLSVLLVFLLVAFASAEAGETRKWTDTQGRSIEAEMIGFDFEKGTVGLKLSDGRELQFPYRQLSENDRGYVRENAPANPATAAAQIDAMVSQKLVSARKEIHAEGAKVSADREMDPTVRNKELARLTFMEKLTHATKPSTDQQFVRRVYLDIAGRIPTYEESEKFFRDPAKNKRSELIDELIDSEAFVSHFFNYMSDLLRIRDGLSMDGFGSLKSAAYADWIKDQIREDRPWNELVAELMTARGYFWENPATGYLLTDYGMELCNLSNTFTVFTGTEITCAQCHDHPFEEVYQMDFYRMAAFFGNLKFDAIPEAAAERKKQLAAKRKQFAAEAKKAKKSSRDLERFLGAYNVALGDGSENRTKLPFDYKYDDAEPSQKIDPAAWFGDIVDLEKYGTPRDAFSDWLTSERNPRFTINVVNRLWKHAFGLAQIEPVDNIPGHLDGQSQNYELLKFLESLMRELDYSTKDFLRILYKTEAYQREACHYSPTLEMIDRGEYHFPAPILRRVSAEQLWDSFVALSVDKPEAPARRVRVLEEYRELMNVNWAKMSFADAEKVRARFNSLGRPSAMMAAAGKKNAPPVLLRASEQRLPAAVGSFLYSFGQSDKRFIENSSREGTIPQVMMLLNGNLTNKVMSAKTTALVRHAQDESSHDQGIDLIFQSVLCRLPQPHERDYADKLVRGGQGGAADYSDLIWALLNTHEFMFIQ